MNMTTVIILGLAFGVLISAANAPIWVFLSGLIVGYVIGDSD